MSSLGLTVPLLRVLAVALLSVAAVSPRSTVSAGMALAGVLLVLLSIIRSPGVQDESGVLHWAGVAVLVPMLASRFESVGPFPASEVEVRPLWIGLALVASVLAILSRRRKALRLLTVIAAASAALVVTVAMTFGEWESTTGFDVYRSHQAAGSALADGENPYGDAVQIPNGSPHVPEGTMIIGYSYPPVVVGTYAFAASLVDPRMVSLVAWLGVLGWLGREAIRNRSHSDLGAAMFLLFAAAPVWPVVWFASWTEPLSLGLILLAALLWKPKPMASAVVLGLALASKQYFIFLAPLVLLHRGDGQLKRALIAFGTAALTILPAVLIDASAYMNATIQNLADIGFRPDTQSLSGLLAESGIDFQLPLTAWIVLGLAFAAAVGPRSKTPAQFLMYSALTLGFVFLIGQAFPNYWFLVMGLVATAAVLEQRERFEPTVRHSPSESLSQA